ncbi:MAG: hypothetical protein DWQ07_15780 [Chloroflexi bacterium]|nr:MAG: hypothetical protein DWQ07_15780 [Chloroflexota bacterium]MBL1195211.1 hypothetical protein [Chloroflexota bacterium]NOH12496.1 hypothetical protein [Chloroflexota bacterium]
MTDKEDRLKAARDKVAKNQAEKRKEEHQERVEDAKAKAEAEARKAELQAKVKEAAEKANTKATHTLTADETLSHLSLKYYGSATEPYWRLIYDANKATIGDNPNHVVPGIELRIPELPEDMKKD